MIFGSKKEARRYGILKAMEKEGKIKDLQMQVPYELIPQQREESTEVYTKGKHKGEPKPGRVLERKCSYVADFVYIKDGKTVVEDVKGYKIGGAYAVFCLKRKLMLYRYGIQVVEV